MIHSNVVFQGSFTVWLCITFPTVLPKGVMVIFWMLLATFSASPGWLSDVRRCVSLIFHSNLYSDLPEQGVMHCFWTEHKFYQSNKWVFCLQQEGSDSWWWWWWWWQWWQWQSWTLQTPPYARPPLRDSTHDFHPPAALAPDHHHHHHVQPFNDDDDDEAD